MAHLEVVRADITTLHVDAIVNAANTKLKGGGGVDGAIHRAAGKRELLAATAPLGGCATGDAKATPGFQLPAKWIFHAVGPVWSVSRGGDAAMHKADTLLASCYRQCMELAREHSCKSIAFPAISTGVYRFPLDRAASIAVRTVQESLPGSSLERVIFCCFNEATEEIYRGLLANRKALDDHAETLKTARALVLENEQLKAEVAALGANQGRR